MYSYTIWYSAPNRDFSYISQNSNEFIPAIRVPITASSVQQLQKLSIYDLCLYHRYLVDVTKSVERSSHSLTTHPPGQTEATMAARHGLGLVHTHAWVSIPVMPVLRAAPIGLAFGRSGVRSFSSSKQTSIPRAISSGFMNLSQRSSSPLSALRIRHKSTQQQPPAKSKTEEEIDKSAIPTPTPTPISSAPKPVDPLTAPPVVVADTPKPPAKTSADTASIIKLLSLAKPQWRLLTVGISCLVVSTGVNLGIPWAIGRIIDYFAPGSEATLLFGLPLEQATWALVGILLVGAVANSGRAMALRLAGQRTVAGIR